MSSSWSTVYRYDTSNLRLPAYQVLRERYKSRDGSVPPWHLTAWCPGCQHSVHEIDKCLMFNIQENLFCDCTYDTQRWELMPYSISEMP